MFVESTTQMLDTIHAEYLTEVKRIHAIAVLEGSLLDLHDVDRLRIATARANAAKQVQAALELIDPLEIHQAAFMRRMSFLLEEGFRHDAPRAELAVYFDILRKTRLTPSIPAKSVPESKGSKAE